MVITVRFIKYCIVGTITTLEGWSIVLALTELCHIWYLYSSMIGTPIVMISAFALNNWWTWGKNNDSEVEWATKLIRTLLRKYQALYIYFRKSNR